MVSSSDYSTALIALIVIVLLFVRRLWSIWHGAVLSVPRLVAYSAFLLGIFALTVAADLLSLPLYSLPADVAVLLGAVYAGKTYIQPRVQLTENPPGTWVYKVGPLILLVYVVLFVLRLTIDFAVIGVDPFAPPAHALSLSPLTTALLAAVDGLFALSAGLAVGRNWGIYCAYDTARRTRSTPTVAAPPLP